MSDYLKPEKYLPHESPMVVLDEVIDVTQDEVTCKSFTDKEHVLSPFLDDNGELPGSVIIELFAQTVGVWNGYHSMNKGDLSCSMGMILGARSIKCDAGSLPAHKEIRTCMKKLMQEDNLGVFEGQISVDGKTAATGQINVISLNREQQTRIFGK